MKFQNYQKYTEEDRSSQITKQTSGSRHAIENKTADPNMLFVVRQALV